MPCSVSSVWAACSPLSSAASLPGTAASANPSSPNTLRNPWIDPKAVFQEIDADILQHGKRFGGLSIGKEWAIFQEAMLISRIRGIFSDILEPEREHGETAYLLCLVDADGSILEASLPSRSVLDKARACLLESVPDAVSGGFEAMTDFMNMDDEGRLEINRRVNARRQAGKPVSFSYAGPDGVPTSLATEQTVEEGIARIKPGDMLVLTPLSPLFLPSGEECLYIACEQDAGQTETLRLSAYIRRGDDYLRVFREMPGREAGLLFRDCFMRRAVPDITDWHVQSWENDWPEERPILFVDDKRFENTSFEDVEAALDGVDGGDYGSFFLMFPGGYDGYLSLNGRQGDNYVVEAALPDEDRYFRIDLHVGRDHHQEKRSKAQQSHAHNEIQRIDARHAYSPTLPRLTTCTPSVPFKSTRRPLPTDLPLAYSVTGASASPPNAKV